MTTKLFSELGISPEVLKAIDRLGFEQASPIQSEAIPVMMGGKDLVGQSQTGSGKTAAFAIPAIERVDPQIRAVQVLILCPTRELAVQVSEEVHKLAFFKRGIHALPIYGGQSYERQFYGLKQGANIVIGTPGRVMDHMRRGTLRLDQVRIAVLDEADVMLDMGFRDDIETILQAVPTERQTVFFSATMPRAIQELIQKYSRDPQNVRIEQKALTVPTVEQLYYEVDRRFKIELLTRIIDLHDLKLGIIFCNTKRMVDDLVDHLNAQGYSADRLHGDMSQGLRDRVMQKFRKSGLEFLVATDVAARGIDVNDVQVVFNYDLPYDVEDYVHRIGRTGRAGRSGLAISFVAGREVFQIRNIERYTNTRVQRAKIPSLTEVEQARASAFLDKVRATLQSGEYKRQDHLIELLLEEGFSTTDITSALIHHLQQEDGRPEPQPDPFARREPPRERGPRPDRVGRRERLEHPERHSRGERSEPQNRPSRGPASSRAVAPDQPDRSAQSEDEERKKPSDAPSGVRASSRAFAPSRPDRAERAERPPRRERPEDQPASPEAHGYIVQEPAIATTDAPAAPSKPLPAFAHRRPPEPPEPKLGKPSRRTPEGQTRIHLSVGQENGATPESLTRAIQGETGLPASILGEIDIRERHTFVDVASDHAAGLVAKLNRSRFGDKRLKVKQVRSGEET